MKKILKRSMAMLLALIMMVTLLPSNLITALAADEYAVGDYETTDDPNTRPTDVEDAVWVLVRSYQYHDLNKCDKLEHTHSSICTNRLFTCRLEEHTHDDSCKSWTCIWQLKADVNNNEIADESETYTVIYTDGVDNKDVFEDEVTSGLAYGAETPTIDDPEREYYTFTGWAPEVVGTVVCPTEKGSTTITYTATWEPNTDKNDNDIADEEETCTVIFDYDGGVDGNKNSSLKMENLAYGTSITAPTVTKEGYKFAGWENLVETVTAPTEGNEITITATWIAFDEVKVTVVDRDSKTEYVIKEGNTVPAQDTPTWDADHDFLGWYVEGSADPYDFNSEIVEGQEDFTIVAKWQEDYNHNDINDATEDTYTVTYVVEGVTKETHTVLTGLSVPSYTGTPVCSDTNYGFAGWTVNGALVDVADMTVDADIAFVAKFSLYIAEVNGTKYTDLQKAFNVCTNGETVKLIADITYTDADVVYAHGGATGFGKYDAYNPCIIYFGGTKGATASENQSSTVNAVLDLNGHTITSTADAYLIMPMDNSQLTIIDSVGTGAMTVENNAPVIWAVGTDTKVDIQAGTYTTDYPSVIWVTHGADMTISGGTFTTTAEDKSESIIVSTKTGYSKYYFVGPSSTLSITGGTFCYDPEVTKVEVSSTEVKYDNFVADGYKSIDNEDGTWTVYPDDYRVIKVTVNKANDEDAVTVNGEDAAAKYITNKTLTILAQPVVSGNALTGYVSTTYVSSIKVNGEAVVLTYNKDYSVSIDAPATDAVIVITFAEAKFDLKEERLMNYYDGMPDVTNKNVYDAITNAPAYEDADEVTIQYKAREEMTQSVSVESLDVSDTIKNILKIVGITSFDFDMDELWLDVNVELDEGQVKESASLDSAVSKYLTEEKLQNVLDAYNNAGGILGGTTSLNAAKAELNDIYTSIYNAAMYYGAHNFGYNATGEETITEAIKITYACDAYYIETETDITLKDMRAASKIEGSDVELMYKNYTDEDLLDAIGATVTDAEGNVIEGAEVYSIEITDPYTFEGKNVSETAYEITLKFAGNDEYKPSEATFTVTVTKAPIDTFDIPNVNVVYGEDYSVAPEVVLGNKYGETSEATDSMIQFVVGLDAAELDVNADGVTGLNATVQLMLPADLQAMLDKITGSDSTGVTMSLSQLTEYLQYIPDTSIDALKEALDAISQITEAGDIQITIGGTYPTDTGVYLVGAVTTNPNYETAWDVAYVIIKPQTEQHYLKFNYEDANGIFSHELLKYVDLNTSAYDDETYTSLDADVSAMVQNIYFGVDEEGNFVATMDSEELGNGAYTQIAFLLDWGNVTYYAEPIARAFVIVPNIANVEIVDKDGNAKDTFEYTFDNTAKEHYVTVDGEMVDAVINYYGVQTNTNTYNSTEAPKNAGAYTAVVTYVERNADGEVIAVGGDVAAIVIEKADMEFNLLDTTVTYDGEGHFVDVTSTPETDYAAVIIDRENNIGNIILEDDANALAAALKEALGKELPTEINVTELIAAINEAIAAIESSEYLTEDMIEALNTIKEAAASLPQSGTIYINGELPVNVGTYEVYAVTYANNYKSQVSKATLEIVPVKVVVTVDDASKYYGNDDPEFTYVVKYYDHEGNELTNISTEVLVELEREEGEDVGEYTITGTATVEDTNFEVVEVVDGTLTIVPAEIEITVDDASKVYGTADPEFTYIANAVNGAIKDDFVVDVKRVAGENVGTYEYIVSTTNPNYVVTLSDNSGVFEITKAKVTVTFDDLTKYYGDEDPTFTFTLEDSTGTITEYYVLWERVEGENVGTYTITGTLYVLSASADNYDIEIVDGTLTIKQAEVVITVDNKTVEGHNTASLTYTIEVVNGVVSDEELEALNVELSREEGSALGEYAITATYTENANIKVTVNDGTYTITLGDYVCWNTETGVYYEIVQQALLLAKRDIKNGKYETTTIQMLKDSDQTAKEDKFLGSSILSVTNGVTFDLNGYEVTVEEVTAYEGAHVVDIPRTGLLKVPENNVYLAANNKMLPVWNGEGYIFTNTIVKAEGNSLLGLKTDGENAVFNFVTYFNSNAREVLNDGASDNNVSVLVRMTWDAEDGTAYQDFVYGDELVGEIVSANGSRRFILTIADYANYTNLTFTAIVVSGTGAQAVGTSYSVAGE